MLPFVYSEFLPSRIFDTVTQIRVNDPERPVRRAGSRRRRSRLAPTGRLNILAADHPARRVTAVGSDPLGMANRQSYLARVVRVLMSELVDGVMATMDILEDLLILDDLMRESSGEAFLDQKILVASLNRGGLAGTAWELDDPITGPGPAACAAWKLDGAKVLLRICDDDPASIKTMLAAASAITELNDLRLPMFLEPLPVVKTEKGYQVVKTAEALAKIAGVASALGSSSRYLWLKLPYCDSYGAVARSTTLPILVLGGESAGDPRQFFAQLSQALSAGSNVRGALAGRNTLYPGDDDPLAAAEAVGGIIHRDWSVEEATASCARVRGRNLDWLCRSLATVTAGGHS